MTLDIPLAALKRPLAGALAVTLTACSSMPQLDMQRLKDIKLPGVTAKPSKTAPAPAEPLAPLGERDEIINAVTEDNQFVRFNAGTPGQLLATRPLTGLRSGEQVVSMDYRVAKGQLFALTSQGRLLRLDPETGAVTPVGTDNERLELPADMEPGMDFNPTVDRIRLVGSQGLNMRLHPDTGARVDGDAQAPGLQPDGALIYVAGDLLERTKPYIVATAYTYNKSNEKLTTNYVIDAGVGYLAIQGSMEHAAVVVSPNTGRLQAVGSLGIERFDRASFDIADLNNAAYLATSRKSDRASRFYDVDLNTGQARLIGTIGAGKPVRAMAIEP